MADFVAKQRSMSALYSMVPVAVIGMGGAIASASAQTSLPTVVVTTPSPVSAPSPVLPLRLLQRRLGKRRHPRRSRLRRRRLPRQRRLLMRSSLRQTGCRFPGC